MQKKPLHLVLSLNDRAILSDLSAQVFEKELSRERLRDISEEYDLHYSLRSLKKYMARNITDYLVKNDKLDEVEEVTKRARGHWEYKIESKDPHRPGHYNHMLYLCNEVLRILEEVEEKRIG